MRSHSSVLFHFVWTPGPAEERGWLEVYPDFLQIRIKRYIRSMAGQAFSSLDCSRFPLSLLALCCFAGGLATDAFAASFVPAG